LPALSRSVWIIRSLCASSRSWGETFSDFSEESTLLCSSFAPRSEIVLSSNQGPAREYESHAGLFRSRHRDRQRLHELRIKRVNIPGIKRGKDSDPYAPGWHQVARWERRTSLRSPSGTRGTWNAGNSEFRFSWPVCSSIAGFRSAPWSAARTTGPQPCGTPAPSHASAFSNDGKMLACVANARGCSDAGSVFGGVAPASPDDRSKTIPAP